MSQSADFADLEKIEIESAVDLYAWAETGRRVAANAGLIVVHDEFDIRAALGTLPQVGGMPAAVRARLVARHVGRAATHLHAAQASMARVPRAFRKHYAELLNPTRQRKVFDLKGA